MLFLFFIFGALVLLWVVLAMGAGKALEKVFSDCSTVSNPINIKVTEDSFESDNIASYPIETKRSIYRPKTLFEYIGQENAKELVALNMLKIATLKPSHFLIFGRRGCGKTTLARIIGNHLQADIIEKVAGEITNSDQIIALINKINYNPNRSILFVDEIHALKPNLCEIFYPILEDFKIGDSNIKPFTFIGATTEVNKLWDKVAPLCDRIQCHVELSAYNEEEIVEIIYQYKTNLFPDMEYDPKNYFTIAQNCKKTPRLAISLLEDNLIEKNIESILKSHRIVKDGLTLTDIKILNTLNRSEKPIGEKALSMMCGISSADYLTVYEPYLVENQFILRASRGRQIGEQGKLILSEIETINDKAVTV